MIPGDLRAPGPEHERGGLHEALRVSGPEPVDPWEVLRAIRARPLIVATEGDEDINGCEAVDELAAIREVLNEALRDAR